MLVIFLSFAHRVLHGENCLNSSRRLTSTTLVFVSTTAGATAYFRTVSWNLFSSVAGGKAQKHRVSTYRQDFCAHSNTAQSSPIIPAMCLWARTCVGPASRERCPLGFGGSVLNCRALEPEFLQLPQGSDRVWKRYITVTIQTPFIHTPGNEARRMHYSHRLEKETNDV